jgi:GNAT superfamily N-acetyltransferase
VVADVSVRPARAGDLAAVADVQVRTWQAAYTALLPPHALDQLTTAQAEREWAQALSNPPTPRHHLLVAVEDDRVVGLIATGPAQDEDLDPRPVAEVLVVAVVPESTGRGHGSRLLAAAIDQLRTEGSETAVTWLFEADGAMQAFLESAGWALDGSARDLDMNGVLVHQLRMHTDLGQA